MKSNWELTKARSQYHFDTEKWNPKWDRVEKLGWIEPCWEKELALAIEAAYPVSWRTRGKPGDKKVRSSEEHDREEYDLESIGMDRDYIVTDINYNVAPVFQHIADQFGLDDCMARIHVQRPGQVWNLHLDKLEKWMPADPTQVVRYFVQLTDWQQGHFWNYGNYMWSRWRAGDVSTFDWVNVPHSTANAGHTPRVTLQITGIKTEKTEKFLNELVVSNSIVS
jgi:hypothetical protein